jgi:hypothetical protein
MTLIAQIILLAAGLFDFLVILWYDVLTLQECGFDNTDYSKLLKDSSEFTSPKRLIGLAVLLGLCTTMSIMSWIVVLILAAVLIIQGVETLIHEHGKRPKPVKRTKHIYATAIAPTVLILAAATGCLIYRGGAVDACRGTALLELLILIGSPFLAKAMNRLFGSQK